MFSKEYALIFILSIGIILIVIAPLFLAFYTNDGFFLLLYFLMSYPIKLYGMILKKVLTKFIT